MLRSLAAAVLGCLFAGAVHAAPPPNANPALTPWFDDLRQPGTNALCCSIADCRPVPSRLNEGHYEAFIDNVWRTVPDSAVLERDDNPTGRAVACWIPQLGVLCFVPPPQS